MYWALILIGAIIVFILFVVAYGVSSDPQDIDFEETKSVGEETVREHESALQREAAQEQAELKKIREYVPPADLEND